LFIALLLAYNYAFSQSVADVKEKVNLKKQELDKARKAISLLFSFVQKDDWKSVKARIYTDRALKETRGDDGKDCILAELKRDQDLLKKAKISKLEARRVDFEIGQAEGVDKPKHYRGVWIFAALSVGDRRTVELLKYGDRGPKVIAPVIQLDLIPTSSGYQIFNYYNFEKIKTDPNIVGPIVVDDQELFILRP
jgi:hypothetical protein